MQFRKSALAAAVLLTTQVGYANSPLMLEEVVVTAQKQSELTQDVPVTVNVVTGETFDNNVAFELKDLNKLTPGLFMNGSKNNPNISLRGVSTVAGGATTPRTNIFLDGAFMPVQQIAFFTQFDIQRFELLRGPQGTLYGKASPTASVVIHTQNPDLTEFEGFVKQSFGQHDLANTQFGVSIPLVEGEMGLRLAGLYDENNSSDYEYAYVDEDQLSRTKANRATFLWEPNGFFSGRVSHTRFDYDSNRSRFIGEVEPDTDPIAGLPPEGADIFDRKDFSDIPTDADIKVNSTVMELIFDFDWATFTSLSFYAESKNNELYDTDSTALPGNERNTQINFTKLFNQEFRLASSGNDFWDWIVGGYYASTAARTTVDNIGLEAFYTTPVNIRTVSTTNILLESGNEDWGFFTHNTFFLSDDWTLTAGARWNKERRTSYNGVDIDALTELNLGSGWVPVNLTEIDRANTNDDSWYAWTGTLKLAYMLSVDETLYATVDRGGRIGGQVLDTTGSVPLAFVSYDPESSNSLEIGYKSELLERRMRLNVSAYYQVYNDFQFFTDDRPLDSNLDGTYDAEFRVTQNAKEVIAQGIEVETTYLFSENLVGTLNIAYNDTKFEDFDDAVCLEGDRQIIADEGVAFLQCDRSGERVGSEAGQWGVNASGSYSLPIDSLDASWYLDVLYNFTSKRLSATTGSTAPSYANVDIFTGLRSLDDSWDVKFWVKNVFDKDSFQNQNDVSPVLLGSQASVPLGGSPIPSGVTQYDLVNDPRQFGVTGTYRFF